MADHQATRTEVKRLIDPYGSDEIEAWSATPRRLWSLRIGRNFLIRMIALGVLARTRDCDSPLLQTLAAPCARTRAEVAHDGISRTTRRDNG
jgi:hypothetical protein